MFKQSIILAVVKIFLGFYSIATVTYLSYYWITHYSVEQNLTINSCAIYCTPESMKLRGTVYPPRRDQNRQYLKLASGMLVKNDSNLIRYRYCAISPDLFAWFRYGDTLTVMTSHILLNGRWVVHDCMASTDSAAIDFLIARQDLKYFPNGIYNIDVYLPHY